MTKRPIAYVLWGGTFQTSVGKDTTYLVAGGNVGASKLKEGRVMGRRLLMKKRFGDAMSLKNINSRLMSGSDT